eukprot:TRINITY_DN7844_c0_g1_i1.p1 TRINITY_DN7844_c0_g1~~TRINITY_DN7844_c0_g1_i1.p1  ORF type:complete len:293 (-),score=18.37 TRINITY_DN7844_c0_g1_i1:9-887(-)
MTSLFKKNDGTSAGDHFAGAGSTKHGCPPLTRHEGDMGSWNVYNGRIYQEKTLDLLALNGPYSIVGRSVVIHEMTDSCTGASGDAGGRIGFGVIGVAVSESQKNGWESAAPAGNLVAVLGASPTCASCTGVMYMSQSSAKSPVTFLGVFRTGNLQPHLISVRTTGELRSTVPSSLWHPGISPEMDPTAAVPTCGELGTVQTYHDGKAYYLGQSDGINLNTLIGRTMVIHQNNCLLPDTPDRRVAAGVIGIRNPVTRLPAVPPGLSIDMRRNVAGCVPTQDCRPQVWAKSQDQ